MPQAYRRTAPPPATDKPLFLGQDPRRRLRRPAHEQHPFESMQAAEPGLVSCGIFAIGFAFILVALVFVLLKAGGLI